MELSRILSVALVGTMAFTASAMAGGTKAGTKISNAPKLSYSMGGIDKKVEAVVASYVVDKVINFTVELKKTKEQNVVAGKKALGVFILTNKGNSVENFVLRENYGSLKDFKFTNSKIYIDANNNDILDKDEMIHTPVLSKLDIDGKKTIWIEATTDVKTVVGKENHYGILAQAAKTGDKDIYKEQSATNDMSKIDIVFADGQGSGDKARDNTAIIRYIWTITQDTTNVKLDIELSHIGASADPANGVCTSYKDFMSGKYQSIPGATIVRRWEITNKTETEAKNVKFSVKIDDKTEKVATTNENTWFKDKTKNVHTILKDDKHIGQGLYNSQTKTIDFDIPSVKPKEVYYLVVITEVK